MKTKARSTKTVSVRRTKRVKGLGAGETTTGPVIDLVPSLLKIRSILVPTDFSPASEKALAYAVRFARQFGARLTLLHVVEPVATPDFAKSFPLGIENDRMIAEGKAHLASVVQALELEPKLMEKNLVRFGRSYHEIVEAARTLKVDLIIIATRGHTGLKHVLLGSTVERVVRYAPCPVLVVRPREREFV